MQVQMQETKVFNDIFSNYEEFVSWLNESYGEEIHIPRKTTFLLIQAEYRVSHIAFTPDTFKDKFFIDLYTYCKEFEKTSDAIDELMDLSDEEISLEGSMIVNMADIPENPSSTNIDTVDFVSQQQKTLSKKGTLQIKREQLSSKRAYTVKTFLKRFRHLFIRILATPYVNVIGEPEGD